MDTTAVDLLDHAAALYARGDFSLTGDPLEHAWADLHPDVPLDGNAYKRASEAISATAGVPHDAHWYKVFGRRNLDQVAALLKASTARAGLPELDAPAVIIDGEVEA